MQIVPVAVAAGPPRRVLVHRQAASILLRVLRNSTFAITAAWLFNYLFSLGNVFSGVPPIDQSLASFTAACIAWSSVIGACGGLTVPAASLMPLRLLSCPDKEHSFLKCVALLLRRTYFSWVVYSVIAVCFSFVLGLCGPNIQRWKLHFYIGGSIINMYTIRVITEARQIYQLETVDSKRRRGSSFSRGAAPLYRRLLRAYKKNTPLFLSMYLAGAYVHGSSQLHLQTPWQLALFSLGSMAMRLVLQEAAAHVVMRQANSKSHHMYTSIMMPTVLIDTEIRIVLLRANASTSQRQSQGRGQGGQLQLTGSVALAIIEVVVRIAKIWWLRVRIQRRRVARRESIKTSVEAKAQFEKWKISAQRFHAAESQADMYAEYIAIGCSLSIYFFYHAHPKYLLAGDDHETNGGDDPHSWSHVQFVVFQVGLEIAIDFVCCMIEITAGVPCTVPRGSSVFVATLVTACAIINVVVSSTIYLVNDDR